MSSDDEDTPLTQHLANAARAGDHERFGELYARVVPALHAWARLRIPVSLERVVSPEDVVQEVWVRAMHKFGDYDASRGRFRQWIFGFAQRVLLEAIKHGLRVKDPSDPNRSAFDLAKVPAEATTISRATARDEALATWIDDLRHLDPEERDLIRMRGLEGMSHEAVGRELGITAATARKKWQRVRRLLEERGVPDGVVTAEG